MTIALSPSTVLVIGNALHGLDDQGTQRWFKQVRERIASGADQWLFASCEDATAAEVLWHTESPKAVVEYPGGAVRPGEPMYEAVRKMMEGNPGEAIVRFGPER